MLAHAERALFVSHPASDSPLFYHELDMVRQDTGVAIMPLVAGRWHPCVAELAVRVKEFEAQGKKIEQVTFERTLRDRSKSHVLRQFMQDVCVLSAVCGRLDRVSALPAVDPESTYANLGVQMSGVAAYPIRWSVAPESDRPHGCLTVVTESAPLRIESRDDPTVWTLIDASKNFSREPDAGPLAAHRAALDVLEESVAAKSDRCDWTEACRSAELTDAVTESLRRGRAIQLHDETYTEASVFKGLMGMAGCGLILLALVITVLGTTVGALLDRMGFRDAANVVGLWRYVLVAIFVVFLLLQLLRFVVPETEDHNLADRVQS